MEKDSMKNLIDDELTRIPRCPAGSTQNLLRAAYQMLQLHCLGKDSRQPPKEPFHQAVEQVRKNDPAFKPNLTDPDYFGWHEKSDPAQERR